MVMVRKDEQNMAHVPFSSSNPGQQHMSKQAPSPVQPRPRSNPFGWWVALTAPPMTAFAMHNPGERDRYRRAQLASGVIPVLLLLGLFQAKNALVNVPTLVGLIVLVAGCFLGAILNRAGAITTAGIVLVAALIITLSSAVIAVPEGLSLIWLPVFQILSLAVIIAGLLLPRWLTLVTALITSFVALSIIAFEPRAADLSTFINQFGYAPIVLRIFADQLITAILVFLLARSIEQAIKRADRAEDLAQAEARIADQARFIADQNARMEFGIQQLLETHRRIAAGDFTVRTPSQQDNELWQIAVSLNNLLSRFGRLAQVEQRLIYTDENLRIIAAQIEIARHGGHPVWPPLNGMPSDQILRALGVAPTQPPPPFAPVQPGLNRQPPPSFSTNDPWNTSGPGQRPAPPSRPVNTSNQWEAMPPELPGNERADQSPPFADDHRSVPQRPDPFPWEKGNQR